MSSFAVLRRRRSLIVLLALVALLAAQLAIAAYACPLLARGGSGEAPPPCHEIDLESPALCKAFLQSDEQGLDSPRAVVDPGLALPLGPLIDIQRLLPLVDRAARLGAALPAAKPPPLIVLLGRRRD